MLDFCNNLGAALWNWFFTELLNDILGWVSNLLLNAKLPFSC